MVMEAEAQSIRERLTSVLRRIEVAAERAGRDPAAIRIVVVTKGHSTETIRAAHTCGIRLLGENRVDEAIPKLAVLDDLADAQWHLIGPLQSRKVRMVQDAFHLIHAVDRIKIARMLQEAAAGLGRRQAVLLECNVSGEATKAGWKMDVAADQAGALAEMREVASLPNLRLLGLMTMAPETDDEAVHHRTFRRLADLRSQLEDDLGQALPELSMGMSDDFSAAVEEGATLVRIGRAILGERN